MRVAIIGGAVAGLAAATRFNDIADEVELYERMTYDEDRTVNCGEGFTSPDLIPIEKTPENGFVQETPTFRVVIHPRSDFGYDDRKRGEAELDCMPSYIADRHIVENSWADLLRDQGVEIHTDTTVSTSRLDEFTEDYDMVIDASGNPGWAAKALDFSREYTGDMIAVNCDIRGDFSDWHPHAYIIHEGYKGYFWIFPKSEDRANIGAGWERGGVPGGYYEEVVKSCEFHGCPAPEEGDLNVYTIPAGPALHTKHAKKTHNGTPIYLVGDAVGTANRYQGEGISQAIRSSYLLADLVDEGRGEDYQMELYEMMKGEYRLAMMMKGLWDEFEDPDLLAEATQAISGLNLHQVTREPYTVMREVAKNPKLAARIGTSSGMLGRVWNAWRDQWEFGTPTV